MKLYFVVNNAIKFANHNVVLRKDDETNLCDVKRKLFSSAQAPRGISFASTSSIVLNRRDSLQIHIVDATQRKQAKIVFLVVFV